MRLSELAEITGSTIENGSPDVEITAVAGLENAGPGDVTFLSNPKYTRLVPATQATAIFLKEKEPIGRTDIAVLRCRDPHVAYANALKAFFPEEPIRSYRHPTAVIDPSATIAEPVEIHANVVIEANCHIAAGVRIMPNVTFYKNVSIGENSTIHSGVSIREGTVIGRNCTVHNNCTIGSDGFGYARTDEKRWLKIPQTGHVVIEDDVEIGANSAIDSPAMGETRIMRGVKIDNLVQIGHSSVIDEDTLVCAQVGMAGSSHIGKRVILAGQAGIGGHITIGDDAALAAQAGVMKDVPAGTFMGGPQMENRFWFKAVNIIPKLPEYLKTIRQIDDRLKKIESLTQDAADTEEKQ